MGNHKPPVEKKRKKKGRPSLLDIQKRTLKQQQKQQQPHHQSRNPSPIPNDVDDDDSGADSRREKKLKLVLHLPNPSSDSNSDAAAGPDGAIGNKDEGRDSRKATDAALQGGETSSSGPTTPLPDEKLLLFLLDRLQKKDAYGVFSEPVDPDELPDYREIIKHPMDFGTVRKKLSGGAYSNLEQFEKDIFLISSNGMCYNSPETIYFRQARSIHELAKKDFESLRQESDDEELEPKTVKRGRPPSKTAIKKPVGRPPVERAASDFSDATLASDFSKKGSVSDKPGMISISSIASLGLHNTEISSWMVEYKAEKSEEYPGFASKGIPTRYGKKPIIVDENRRNTYRQPQPYTVSHDPPILSAFDGEKQQLISVGLQIKYAYARSLARFAANIGPIGWALAAEKIERALPPGMKFGRGWVCDSEAPKQSQPPLLSTSPLPTALPRISPFNTVLRGDKTPKPEPPSDVEEGQFRRSSDSVEHAGPSRGSDVEAGSNLPNGGNQSKDPFQLQRNGFSTPFGFNLASQLAKMVRPVTPSGSLGLETPMTHGRALDLVSRGKNSFVQQLDEERAKLAGNSSTVAFGGSVTDPSHDPQGTWRGLSLQGRPDSVPPDLNVQFQPPLSPVSGLMVDSQQPDLALQL